MRVSGNHEAFLGLSANRIEQTAPHVLDAFVKHIKSRLFRNNRVGMHCNCQGIASVEPVSCQAQKVGKPLPEARGGAVDRKRITEVGLDLHGCSVSAMRKK